MIVTWYRYVRWTGMRQRRPSMGLMRFALHALLLFPSLALASDSPNASPIARLATIPFLPNISKCKGHDPTTYPIDAKPPATIKGTKLYALPLLSNGPANQMSQLKNALMLGKLLGR